MTTLSPFSGSPTSQNGNHEGHIVVAPPKAATKSKPRKRVNTAEKRHQHNAIERQRRETLNGKFLSLARLLPSLASHRRPSKSAIVNGSISHLTHQRDQRLLAAKLLRSLCSEHDDLLREVNEWRKANGFALKDNTPAWTEEVDDVCSVEKEVFGNFATMGGDGDDDGDDDNENENENDNENDTNVEMSLDQAAAVAASFHHGNGLITPRSSAEMESMAQAQAMFGTLPVPDKRASAAAINGLNWSNDFAFSMNPASVASTNSSLPFNNFIAEQFDHSSSGSPANSQNGNVLTPPNTADRNVYTHTPSPRSSTGGMEEKVIPSQHPAVGGWTAQQLLFLQQQQQQQQQQQLQQQQQAQLAHLPSAFVNPALPTGNLFAQPAHITPTQAHNFGSDAFTQSLLASMFPQNAATVDQIQQWRRAALGNLLGPQTQMQNTQPSLDELKNAVRAGMGLGLGMAGVWPEGQNHPVEGF